MRKHCTDCGIIFETEDPDETLCMVCRDIRDEPERQPVEERGKEDV